MRGPIFLAGVIADWIQQCLVFITFSAIFSDSHHMNKHTLILSFPLQLPGISSLCYLLVSPISYSLSLSSSKMSTSSLPVVERLVFLLMLSLARVMAKRSPLLHSIGSSRMAAEKKGRGESTTGCEIMIRDNYPH